MKKEIVAAAILILLFALAIINIWVLDNLTGEILELLDESEESAKTGDMESAVKKALEATDIWHEADFYTHILLRHSEIDSTTDSFYELITQLKSGERKSAEGAFGAVRARLKSLAEIEHIKPGSIF